RQYSYADTGYVILGEIVERTTGKPLPAAVSDLLKLKSLGIRSTYFESLEPPPPGALPRAHQYLGAADIHDIDPSFDLYGGGGQVSTTADLSRFFKALFQGRVFDHPETLAAGLVSP